MNDKLIKLLANPDFKCTLRINEHFRTTMYQDGEKIKHLTLTEYFKILNKGIEPSLIHPDSVAGKEILKHNTIVELYVSGRNEPFHYSFIGHSIESVYEHAETLLKLTRKIK